MSNEELKAKYDDMHRQGVSSWFSDGKEERETILEMGSPWHELTVLEIGCGEGDLAYRMMRAGAHTVGIDYSPEAMVKASEKHGQHDHLGFYCCTYKAPSLSEYGRFDRLVMQGVLEHLDDPFIELQWMIEHFKPKTVITSSPCFLNPRGIVWMTLDMLGAVMSKTDLHFLHPWEFEEFCHIHNYKLEYKDCDMSWGNRDAMIQDLKKRIPLALADGNLPEKSPYRLLRWLDHQFCEGLGATMVYKIEV